MSLSFLTFHRSPDTTSPHPSPAFGPREYQRELAVVKARLAARDRARSHRHADHDERVPVAA